MKTVILQRSRIHTGDLIVVNAACPYQEDAAGPILISVNAMTDTILLDRHAANLLSNLMDKLDGWRRITAVSGWRSVREQKEIYDNSFQENGKTFTEQFVALPGCSEHQTGLAIDLALKGESIDFICPDFPYTGICQTFRQRAISYGFIERYPRGKESITGISHEPWHFRYVGTPHAKIMWEHDLVLEEYISFLKNYPYGKEPYLYYAQDLCVSISYLEAKKETDTRFVVDDRIPYSVSGNNMDGFIITQWRSQNDT